MYDYESSASLFDMIRLFDQTLRQLLAVPELALFLGTALLWFIKALPLSMK